MTQQERDRYFEEKNLIFKDLCGRIPYHVHVQLNDNIHSYPFCENHAKHFWGYTIVKPYLFPLSSMTEEQKNECFNGTPLEIDKYGDIAVKDDFYGNSQYTDLEVYLKVIDWLNANHFDYRNLIPMGLAIDATNLNIYQLCGK